jgi:hypothetical protein
MNDHSVAMFHAALKVVIKRAIIVLDALGDSEMRFQNQGRVWNRAINDAALACGYTEATVRFIPTAREIAQAEIVAGSLLWLGNNEGGVRTSEIEASGLTPLDYMLGILRDEQLSLEDRMDAAKAFAPYVHAKLASVELGRRTTHRPEAASLSLILPESDALARDTR